MHLIDETPNEDPDAYRDRQVDQDIERRSQVERAGRQYDDPYMGGKRVALAVLRRLDGDLSGAERELALANQWLANPELPRRIQRALAGYATILNRFVQRSYSL
jgi:hypothetical protein